MKVIIIRNLRVATIFLATLSSHPCLDLLVCHQPGKNFCRDVVQPVAWDHRVCRAVVPGEPGPVAAEAHEGDLKGLICGDGVGGRGGGREAVGAEEVAEVLDIEQALDVAQRGGVRGHVAYQAVAGGARGVACELGCCRR